MEFHTKHITTVTQFSLSDARQSAAVIDKNIVWFDICRSNTVSHFCNSADGRRGRAARVKLGPTCTSPSSWESLKRLEDLFGNVFDLLLSSISSNPMRLRDCHRGALTPATAGLDLVLNLANTRTTLEMLEGSPFISRRSWGAVLITTLPNCEPLLKKRIVRGDWTSSYDQGWLFS